MHTRYAKLGYRKDGPDLWRLCTTEDGCAVGPHYASKAELLADLERFAAEFGCDEAQAAAQDTRELIETLLRALHGALNVEGHARYAEHLKYAGGGCDIPYHYNRIRDAINAASALGYRAQ
jgi:hypothetical protein